MLLNSLYVIIEKPNDGNLIFATIELNDLHEIFQGHFPSKPVLPGACMLQMIKEILENTIGEKLKFKNADEIKFLQLIEPSVNKFLKFQIRYTIDNSNTISVNAKILKINDVVCCKLKSIFVFRNNN